VNYKLSALVLISMFLGTQETEVHTRRVGLVYHITDHIPIFGEPRRLLIELCRHFDRELTRQARVEIAWLRRAEHCGRINPGDQGDDGGDLMHRWRHELQRGINGDAGETDGWKTCSMCVAVDGVRRKDVNAHKPEHFA